MRAAVLTGHGGPECLEVRDDLPVPEPGSGQVLVRVAAASVNNTDVWTRQGAYGRPGDPDARSGWRGPVSFPRIQGGDVAGWISEVGDGVDGSRVGDRVIIDPCRYEAPGEHARPVGLLGSEFDGGFAQYVVVDADQAYEVNSSPLSDEQLASIPIAYGTAMGMLERGKIGPGETVLVTGASGGVGLALVQLASARDARVIALTSASKRPQVEAAGAASTVSRSDPDLLAALARAAPTGLDAALDVAAGRVLSTAFSALAESGRWVVAGAVDAPIVNLDVRRLYLHQRQIIGSSLHTRVHFRRLVDEARRGSVDPSVAGRYALSDIHQAQGDFAAGRHIGKLVLRPDG